LHVFLAAKTQKEKGMKYIKSDMPVIMSDMPLIMGVGYGMSREWFVPCIYYKIQKQKMQNHSFFL